MDLSHLPFLLDQHFLVAQCWLSPNDSRMRAFNAATGAVVWNGGGAGDSIGAYSNFISPVIAKGRVYVGTHGKIAAFGPH